MIRLQWFVCDRGVIHVRHVYVAMWNGMLVVLRPRAVDDDCLGDGVCTDPQCRRHGMREFRQSVGDKWRLQASKADLN